MVAFEFLGPYTRSPLGNDPFYRDEMAQVYVRIYRSVRIHPNETCSVAFLIMRIYFFFFWVVKLVLHIFAQIFSNFTPIS